jgi:PPOX class probable F420-dependent enzyme
MELSSAVREYLSAPRFAVLATIDPRGVAQQTVMWYDLDGDTILMNTKDGRLKAANLRADARVSICVPDGYRFVTLTGTAQLNDDQDVAQRDIRRLAVRYSGGDEGEIQRAEKAFAKERRITIRVPIERVLAYGVGE